MIEKPKVLVVYGYHSEETFAIDVGLALERQLEENPLENVQVMKYTGANPRTVDDFLPRSQDRGRLMRQFVHDVEPIDYLIDLHDESPRPRNQTEQKALMKRFPPLKKSSKWVIGFPPQTFDYISRNALPKEMYDRIVDYCHSDTKNISEVAIADNHADAPGNYDHIEICYYPHLTTIKQATSFIRGIIPILQSYKNTRG